jgi:MerR family transcriptional regulator/heat shock protein HspR
MRYERLSVLCERFSVEKELVDRLVEEGILRPRRTLDDEVVLPLDQAEELRVATVLVKELGVNVEGVEVIIPMRRRMLAAKRENQLLVEKLRDQLLAVLRDPAFFGPAGYLETPPISPEESPDLP